MELYTLDSDFLRKDVVDDFSSAIWTDRHNVAGEVKLSVTPSDANRSKLATGTFLSKVGSKEVMLLDTMSEENGVLTVTGGSLLGFLKHRIMWADGMMGTNRNWWISNDPDSTVIKNIVEGTCVQSSSHDEIGGALNVIEGLSTSNTTGDTPITRTEAIPLPANVYETITALAKTEPLGIRLYLDSASASSFSLVFEVYRGVDRTSDQAVVPVIRFSSAVGNLLANKELYSIADFKTAAYVITPPYSDNSSVAWGAATAPGIDQNLDFDRRVMYSVADDLTEDGIGGPPLPAWIYGELNQRAANVLANNNFVKIVDGEIIPQGDQQYGTHYNMGDIVELQGASGIIQKARITEFIHSQDATGERAYPTVSIVE